MSVRLFLIRGSLLLCLFAGSGPLLAENTISWLSAMPVKAQGPTPNNITQVLQDNRGFIWIATLNGLYVYDGLHYTVFRNDPRDRTSLPSNLITSMTRVGDRLLLGFLQGGVYWFDTLEQKLVSPGFAGKTLDLVRVQSLLLEDSVLWIGGFNGLYRVDRSTNKVVRYAHNPLDEFTLPGRLVNQVLRDRAAQLWVATDGGLARFDEQAEEFIRFQLPVKSATAEMNVTRLFLDADGSLWVGTDHHGLFHVFGAGSRVEPVNLGVQGLSVRDILRSQTGEIWAATDQGVFVLPIKGKNLQRLKPTPGDTLNLSDADTWALFQDRSELIWIGTTRGLFNSNPVLENFGRLLQRPLSELSLANNYVSGVVEDEQGGLLIATLSGLDRYLPSNDTLQHLSLPRIAGAHISQPQALKIDKSGNLWLGDSTGHVLELDAQQHLIQHYDLNPNKITNDNPIHFIYQTHSGEIWVGAKRVLTVIDAKGKVRQTFERGGSNLLGRAETLAMVEDSSGNLWFATRGTGLVRYHPDSGEVEHFIHSPDNPTSLSHDNVNTLLLDEHGALWIGSTNGLNRLRRVSRQKQPPEFETWLTQDGLADPDIRSLGVDGRGWIWLATAQGLSRLNPKTDLIENFGPKDGIANRRFSVNAVASSASGYFYFGGDNGLTVLMPDNFHLNLIPPKVALTAINVPGRGWRSVPSQRLALNYNENDIAFRAVSLDFNEPDRNLLRYRLIGYDAVWHQTRTNNPINYTNLNADHYRFEVIGSNNHGVWSEEAATFEFDVLPPWWGSLWAFAAYLLIFAVLVYWVHRSHRATLEKERAIAAHLRRNDQLKDEFLAVISHELRTPLTGIIGITEAMLEGSVGTLSDRLRRGLDLIRHSGKRLSILVNEILDFKKMAHQNLHLNLVPVDIAAAVQVVVATCEPLIGGKPLTLKTAIPADLPAVLGDGDRLLQILYNLVGNAVKFTDEGEVWVEADARQGRVIISIRDSGIGIATEYLQSIFKPFEQLEPSNTRRFGGSGLGLAITRQLVELHNSELKVESQLKTGSRFYFALKIADGSSRNVAYPVLETSSLALMQEPGEESDIESGSAGRVLVADDEVVNRTVICEFLRIAGYQTCEAQNGEEALALALQRPFDLLVLDVMMPGMSGFEVCSRVRKKFTPIERPILLISARKESQDVVTGLAAGANDYISKPIDKNVLLARVSTLVSLGEINQVQKTIEEKRALQQACDQLSRYFPKELVERVIAQGQAEPLAPSRELITVLFADLVGFTELTDRFEAEVITDLINQFIRRMSELVEHNHGVLNEVLGDGLVVLFGAPSKQARELQSENAVRLGIEMQQAMTELGQCWLDNGLDHNVQLRIGIHQDFATVGNIGSETLIAYRAIGSGVNLASRLEAECTPGNILVTFPVFAQTRDKFSFGPLQEVCFKGFHHSHRVCELSPTQNEGPTTEA